MSDRLAEIREQTVRWLTVSDPPDYSHLHTIPASPDDIMWMVEEIERLRARVAELEA